MALYRLSASVVSRSNGSSAIASSAYRSGERLMDERTNDRHDYTRKSGILAKNIEAPDGSPAWVFDRQTLWNKVEESEKRYDSQLAREIMVALPSELDRKSQKELIRDFVRETFVKNGMVADWAFHAPCKEGDERNYHAHILLTTRELKEEGFGKKERSWNSPELLEKWREQWAEKVNNALELSGISARVDHRSYKDQGIDREPGIHLGPELTAKKREIEKIEKKIERESLAYIDAVEDSLTEAKKVTTDEQQNLLNIPLYFAKEDAEKNQTFENLGYYQGYKTAMVAKDLKEVIKTLREQKFPGSLEGYRKKRLEAVEKSLSMFEKIRTKEKDMGLSL